MTISPAYKSGNNEDFDPVKAEEEIDGKLEQINQLFTEIEIELSQFPIKNVSTAVLKYIKLRDKLGVARKAFETFETLAKNAQDVINQYLIAKSDEEGGIQNFNTPFGTAYRKTKISYRVQDWDAYINWMSNNDMLHCVEKRPAKTAVQEYFDSIESENDLLMKALKSGEISEQEFEEKYVSPTPPGLERHVELEFGFRKS